MLRIFFKILMQLSNLTDYLLIIFNSYNVSLMSEIDNNMLTSIIPNETKIE